LTPVPPPTAKPAPTAPQQAQVFDVVQQVQEVAITQAFVAQPLVKRFQFNIAPGTPLKDLLPVSPRTAATADPLTVKDLAHVPEVEFQKPITRGMPVDEEMKQTAHMIARINHLNGKKSDAFLEALRSNRPDLGGLPFAMGDACRTKGERSKQFALAVATVRAALGQQGLANSSLSETRVIAFSSQPVPPPTANGPATVSQPIPAPAAGVPVDTITRPTVPLVPPPPPPTDRKTNQNFWNQYQTACAQEDKKMTQADRCQHETATVARIAALMQVLAPESASVRLGLVKYLSAVAHVEATRALARLAVFSSEDEVRQAAVDALKVRRERDYTDVLLAGLRYPWPDVAKHAADAVTKLERMDLVPQLVALLDEPDPRAPLLREVNKKQVPVVRELVRINHHQNCLLCHAPGNTGTVAPETLTAEVPIPDQPLPSPGEGYRNSSPDLVVRIDVTYLRQDFSAYLPVADANPWPEMQRFDFLTRTRVLTQEEAASYRQALGKEEPGRPSPYRRAVLAALRELTGRDTEPTAAGWRKVLGLPARQFPAPLHDAG
jgi:hypothetical protein